MGNFVFDRQIEIVRAIEQAFKSAFVLRQHRGANARYVVEVNAAERKVAEVLGRSDLDTADLSKVRLVRPAEKTGQPAGLVLKLAGALEMLNAFFDGFIKAYDHGCGGLEAGVDNSRLCFEILRDCVFEFAVAAAEVFGKDLGAASRDPAYAGVAEALCSGRVVELGVVGKIHELGNGERVKLERIAVAGADGGKQITVVIKRQVRIEAAVEGCEIAA